MKFTNLADIPDAAQRAQASAVAEALESGFLYTPELRFAWVPPDGPLALWYGIETETNIWALEIHLNEKPAPWMPDTPTDFLVRISSNHVHPFCTCGLTIRGRQQGTDLRKALDVVSDVLDVASAGLQSWAVVNEGNENG